MNTKDISCFALAVATCLWISSDVAVMGRQQDLSVPLGNRPSEPIPREEVQVPVIRPGNSGRLPTTPFLPPRDQATPSDQRVLVNSDFAGWQGANGQAIGRTIGDRLRGNWIMVDENGTFDGTVVPGNGASVANMNVFLMHMGRLVKQTTLDEDGRFRFTNVRQGAYALTGWGDRGLFTFGLNILANNPNATDTLPPNSITITAFQNQTAINTDWIKFYSPQVGFRVFGRYAEGEGAKNSSSLYGSIGLYNNLPANKPATSISSHVVRRTPDGRLVGRVHQFNSLNGRPVDVRTTKILLLEEDSVVAATNADNFGTFEFEQVPNGSYGVLAAGVDGVGLIGITVGDDRDQDDEVAFDAADLIDFTMIPAETVGWLNSYAQEVEYQRNLAAPRRPTPNQADQLAQGLGGCAICGGQPGGCERCQREYLESACRQRGITFEQWQLYGCQQIQSGFGQGRFIRSLGEDLRGRIDRVDAFYENAFTPDNSERILGELQAEGILQNRTSSGFGGR